MDAGVAVAASTADGTADFESHADPRPVDADGEQDRAERE